MEAKDKFETISSLVKQINPIWNDIGDAFLWPPDLFHVCAYLLKKTGAYRNVIDNGFQIDVEFELDESAKMKMLDEWLEEVQTCMIGTEKIKLPEKISSLKKRLVELSDEVTFNQLRVLNDGNAKKLSKYLITALALADQACGGFGLPGKPGFRRIKKALIYYVANSLLVTRGSLSSLSKFSGVVVPKMRTPQTGLTIRSLSLHLAFLETEVEIMWRSVPWVNLDQNTLNVLCVPWPEKIDNIDFENQSDTFENVRYFSYNKKPSNVSLESVIETLKATNQERCRVHLVVFPELSLEYNQYRSFLGRLKEEYENEASCLNSIPMVVGGITFADKDYNAVVLAVYFSGKWYMMLQTKHHRWKLTRSQIIQYELTGTFSVEREWFEGISISQRRLSFFSPNSWLTLCPLICEDLAQLEPVSEVIRGVGPSLLIALLMDGPQLKERWPARYASIFADDPGTAVLTLTSLGMLKRSKTFSATEQNEVTVGLWKDQLNGWANIDVGKNKSNSTALLTLSASMKTEFSADGRNDDGYAPAFKLDSVYFPETITKEEQSLQTEIDNIWMGDWNDLRELTSVNFALDALLTTCGEYWDLIIHLANPSKEKYQYETSQYKFLLDLIVESTLKPEHAGINPFEEKEGNAEIGENDSSSKPHESLEWAIIEFGSWKQLLTAWFKEKSKVDFNKAAEDIDFKLRYYKALFDKAESDLATKSQVIKKSFAKMGQVKRDRLRIERAVPLAVMISLHNRLDSNRFKYNRINHKYSKLFMDVEKSLKKYMRFG
jgi:hypothetical protein